MSDIRIIVLDNGQQLLGEVEDSEGGFLISHPMLVVTAPPDPRNPEKGPRVGLNHYLPYTKDFEHGLFIDEKRVIGIAVPVDELEGMHKQMFSPIITPGLITPR